MSASAMTARAARGAVRARRAMSTSVPPTRGPVLPAGNDPAAYHSKAAAAADTSRWALISALFALPVGGFGVLQAMAKHEHAEAPIQYDYMRRANRSPRFPWGVRRARRPPPPGGYVSILCWETSTDSSALATLALMSKQDDDLIGCPYEKHAEGEH
jgi:hypothetical protein